MGLVQYLTGEVISVSLWLVPRRARAARRTGPSESSSSQGIQLLPVHRLLSQVWGLCHNLSVYDASMSSRRGPWGAPADAG